MGMPMYPSICPTPRTYSKVLTPIVQERCVWDVVGFGVQCDNGHVVLQVILQEHGWNASFGET